jgi:hypothetical protein
VSDVKTNALMPSGDNNGLALIAAELAAEGRGDKPPRLRAVIALIDCRRVTVDADTHEEVATVRFRRVEVVLPGDMPAAEKLIRRALEARTDQPTLPLELEDELEATFREMTAVDPEDPDAPPTDPGDMR